MTSLVGNYNPSFNINSYDNVEHNVNNVNNINDNDINNNNINNNNINDNDNVFYDAKEDTGEESCETVEVNLDIQATKLLETSQQVIPEIEHSNDDENKSENSHNSSDEEKITNSELEIKLKHENETCEVHQINDLNQSNESVTDPLHPLIKELEDHNTVVEPNVVEDTQLIDEVKDNIDIDTHLKDDEYDPSRTDKLLENEASNISDDKDSFIKALSATIEESLDSSEESLDSSEESSDNENIIDETVSTLPDSKSKYKVKVDTNNTVDGKQTATIESDNDHIVSSWFNCLKTKVKSPIITEKQKIIWPKKAEKWVSVLAKIENHINTFTDEKTPHDSIKKLSCEIYDICKTELGVKKYTPRPPERVIKRDELLNEIHPIKSHLPKKKKPLTVNDKQKSSTDVSGNVNNSPTQKEMDIVLSNHFKAINSSRATGRVSIKTKAVQNKDWLDYNIADFTKKEFDHILATRLNNKSNFDGLCYELVRKSTPLTNKLLTLYNNIAKSNHLPKDWHYGFIYDTYKGSGDINNVKNYRCIVRIDTFSKLYWYLVCVRLKVHYMKHNIINSNIQKAFIEDVRGTEESLFIHQQVKPKSKCVVYIDLKNAYGSIQPKFLDRVLKFYGVKNTIRKQINSYVKNRHVYFNKELRKWDCGLPQGLSMSNHLFNLCMNYIIDFVHNKYVRTHGVYVHNCNFLIQAFADDVVIYGNNIDSTQEVVNELYTQFKAAGLKVQVGKCYVDYIKPKIQKTVTIPTDKKSDNKIIDLTTTKTIMEEQDIVIKNKIKINNVELPDLKTNKNFKYLGQYANMEDNYERFAVELKNSLDRVKVSFEKNLKNVSFGDYWYAYQRLWRYKINWFMRVNNVTAKKAACIEKVEKDWFSQFDKLKDRLTEEDYKIRRENMMIVRHSALNESNDSRVVTLYKKSINPEQFDKIAKAHKEKYNNKLSRQTGFKKCVYNHA
jgi:hypothetical protein